MAQEYFEVRLGDGHAIELRGARWSEDADERRQVDRTGEEERILFTYNPVASGAGLPQPGPVFIHKEPCRAFDGDGIPPELRTLPLFLEAFGRGTWLVRREPVDARSMEADIQALLRDPAIEQVLIRNAEAGCFIARAERSA